MKLIKRRLHYAMLVILTSSTNTDHSVCCDHLYNPTLNVELESKYREKKNNKRVWNIKVT